MDRSNPTLTTAILDELKWLGLDWDEGPYYQSERLHHYGETGARLERLGHTYPCFCTPEELRAKRQQAEAERRPWRYDGTCRRLAPAEVERRRAQHQAYALRFLVPESGRTAFDDEVYGHLEVENREVEDFVLLRSDGHPTYHLSVVADDLDMKITHVVRGADHLSNTPKQVLLYRALGAPQPTFAHLPLILGPDRQRLSKRHGATAVGAYREQGILPEALGNFLALLGWTPPGEKEIVPLEEMIRDFDLKDVSKSNAVFDLEKLAWMNSEYLRHLPEERLFSLVRETLKAARLWSEAFTGQERDRFETCARLVQTRARSLLDFSHSGRAFFTDDYDYDLDARRKFWNDPALADRLATLSERLSRTEPFDSMGTEHTLRALAKEEGIQAGLLINAARVALTGQAVAPGLFVVMVALGRDRVVQRLRRGAEFLRKAQA